MANLQAVLDELAAKVEEDGATKLPDHLEQFEKKFLEAARKDLASIFGLVLNSLGHLKPYGTPDGYREVTICSTLGYITFNIAYYGPQISSESRQVRRLKERMKAKGRLSRLPKNGTYQRKGDAPCSYPLKEALQAQESLTPYLYDMIQRSGVIAGSFEEGSSLLSLFLGVTMPTSTFRRKVLAAGKRALKAQEAPPLRLLTPHLPAWLLATTTATAPTMYIMLDGTCVPCVKKDTKGVKGKGADGQAGSRELKVAIVGTYRRLNKHGRPVRDPGCESHIVSPKKAKEFGTLLRKLANSRGFGGKKFRVQIVGDGAEWISNIVQEAFPGQSVIFTNDFYHTCEYLHAFITLAADAPENVMSAYKLAKSILLRYGGSSLVKHLKKRYNQLDSKHAAWQKLQYVENRLEYMKYHEYRKQGLFIGSGPVEAACRTDVARRCKQAGMHWRLKNAAFICALTARFKSRLHAA
jgi:hypothetical protein